MDRGRLICLIVAMACLFVAFLEVVGAATVLWSPLAWVILAGVFYLAMQGA